MIKKYISLRIATLIAKHAEYTTLSSKAEDEEMRVAYSTMAVDAWNTISELKNMLEFIDKYEKSLTSTHDLKVRSLRVWPCIEAGITIKTETGAGADLFIPPVTGRNVFETIDLLFEHASNFIGIGDPLLPYHTEGRPETSPASLGREDDDIRTIVVTY